MKINLRFFSTLQGIILIVIITLVLFTVLFAFINSQSSANDAKRVSDVTKIQAALKVSFDVNGFYPDSMNNQPKGITSILDFWPVAPAKNGGCSATDNTYIYSPRSNGADYALTFCLGKQQAGMAAGVHTVTSEGIK